MTANTTNVINGQPQPGTLLPLNGATLVVRSIPLGTIKAGETIKALSEVEVTNDLVTQDGGGTNQFHDVAAALSLVIADSPTATSGIEIAEDQGNFVTPQVHHWTFEKSGTLDRDPAAQRPLPEPGDVGAQPREPDRVLDLPALEPAEPAAAARSAAWTSTTTAAT